MSRPTSKLVLLTRFPRVGEVKTRIAEQLGAEAARDLHDRLAKHTLKRLLALQACGEASVEVRTDASFHGAVRDWLGKGPGIRYQGEGDLGTKLANSFASGFSKRVDKVVVVGSDCPALESRHLREALAALDTHDVVLGPATDGGYYLIGLSRSASARALGPLFADMPWGSSEVLLQTIHAAENTGLVVALLDELPDVDRPEDVEDAEANLSADSIGATSRVSVVMPALDDCEFVELAVASAWAGGAYEVIVADGGSGDATRERARTAGAVVIDSPRGRAAQMNAGAARAAGEVLCFLHADTVLPAAWADSVRDALAAPGTVAAGFDFAVDRNARHAAIIATVGRLRWRLSGIPFGDQAVCVPRYVFDALGGFPDLPVMEDLEFALRARRLGRIAHLSPSAVTSARAWDEHGLVLPTAINAAGILAYRAGVSPARIAQWRSRIAPAGRGATRRDSAD